MLFFLADSTFTPAYLGPIGPFSTATTRRAKGGNGTFFVVCPD